MVVEAVVPVAKAGKKKKAHAAHAAVDVDVISKAVAKSVESALETHLHGK